MNKQRRLNILQYEDDVDDDGEENDEDYSSVVHAQKIDRGLG